MLFRRIVRIKQVAHMASDYTIGGGRVYLMGWKVWGKTSFLIDYFLFCVHIVR
jgi:hypothetical protein